jgi:sorting and assembly machinery component 37
MIDELPALRRGDTWIGGFRNIVDYVAKCSDNAWSLDEGLKGVEKADCIAYVRAK